MHVARVGISVVQVYELSSVKDNWCRSELLNEWNNGGGVMIMGYEMFRNLSQLCRVKNKKQKKIFTETLLDPGKSASIMFILLVNMHSSLCSLTPNCFVSIRYHVMTVLKRFGQLLVVTAEVTILTGCVSQLWPSCC